MITASQCRTYQLTNLPCCIVSQVAGVHAEAISAFMWLKVHQDQHLGVISTEILSHLVLCLNLVI